MGLEFVPNSPSAQFAGWRKEIERRLETLETSKRLPGGNGLEIASDHNQPALKILDNGAWDQPRLQYNFVTPEDLTTTSVSYEDILISNVTVTAEVLSLRFDLTSSAAATIATAKILFNGIAASDEYFVENDTVQCIYLWNIMDVAMIGTQGQITIQARRFEGVGDVTIARPVRCYFLPLASTTEATKGGKPSGAN